MHSLQEVSTKYESIKIKFNKIEKYCHELEIQLQKTEQMYEETNEKLKKKEKIFFHQDQNVQIQLDSAAELAEKQNALTLTLEAKVL